MGARLPKSFYEQPTLELAGALLGKLLISGETAGYIVETEAYIGESDRAAHTHRGMTERTRAMFGPPGHAYVYTIHTHHCFNVTSGPEGKGEGVLIRALRPKWGVETMKRRRGLDPEDDSLLGITNGPGKLCQAMGITMEQYGSCLYENDMLTLSYGMVIPKVRIMRGPRIGIENTGEAAEYPWRFWVSGDPHVSK